MPFRCIHLETFQVRIALIVGIIYYRRPWFVNNKLLYSEDIVLIVVGSIKVRDVEITVLKDDKNAVLVRELTKIVAVIFVVDAVDIWVKPHLSSTECRMTMTLQGDAVYTFFGQKITFRCTSLYENC